MSALEDIRVNSADEEEVLRTVIGNMLSSQILHLPVMATKDSKDGNTVKLKSTLKFPKQGEDGTTTWVELPEFDDAIIRYQGAGGITSTHPIKEGDEGWVTFGSRGVSNWHEQGGVQQTVDMRGALSDAMFHPGSRSKPNMLKGVSGNSAQTRTDDKQSLHDISHTAVTGLRGTSVHQANDQGLLSQKNGASHFVDGMTIQNVAGKILMNC